MKYDLEAIERKLCANTLPQSMRKFDAKAYVDYHSRRAVTVRRSACVQAIFDNVAKGV